MKRSLATIGFLVALTIAYTVTPNYGEAPDFPAVGRTGWVNGTTGVMGTTGSATAISPSWILTAFHVGSGGIFEQNGVRYTMGTRINHTDPSGNVDLALIQVRGPVQHAAPISRRPYQGTDGIFGQVINIVGVGMTGERTNTGFTTVDGTQGVRRSARNVVDLRGNLAVDFGGGNVRTSDYLIYDLDDPLGQSTVNTLGGSAVTNEGGQAGWDSGGGWFIPENGRLRQVAVISVVGTLNGSGVSNWRNFGGIGAAVFLQTYKPWILANVTDFGDAILNLATAEIGTRTAGTHLSLYAEDAEFVRVVSPNLEATDVFPLVSARIRGVTTESPASTVRGRIRGRVSVPLATVAVSLRDVTANRWDRVGTYNFTSSYQNFEFNLNNAGKYVSTSGSIEARIAVLESPASDVTSVSLTLDRVTLTAR